MIITSQIEVRSRNVKTVGERGDSGEDDGVREKCVGSDVLKQHLDFQHAPSRRTPKTQHHSTIYHTVYRWKRKGWKKWLPTCIPTHNITTIATPPAPPDRRITTPESLEKKDLKKDAEREPSRTWRGSQR